jgi:hypothetical protein
MPNYENGKIYKLWSPSNNLVYYGSTTETLSQRLAKHKCGYKAYNNDNTKSYITAYKILECEDYKIELVEAYSCNNKSQLEKKEGEYAENNECVNKRIEGKTKKEQRKKYNEDHKEDIKKNREQHKEDARLYSIKYREENREKLLEDKKKYYENHKKEMLEKMKKKYQEKKEK